MKVDSTFDEFASLDDEVTDFITYIAGVLRGDISQESMIAIIQMQTKIFNEINIIKAKQDWLENKFMELDNGSPPRQH